jgi:hypothetical protein
MTFELEHATFTNFPATENADGSFKGDYREMDLAIDIAHYFSHRPGRPSKRLVGDWKTVKKFWEAGKGIATVNTPQR